MQVLEILGNRRFFFFKTAETPFQNAVKNGVFKAAIQSKKNLFWKPQKRRILRGFNISPLAFQKTAS